jgi:hypothetical protein
MPSSYNPYERALILAALSGLKFTLGPAFLRTAQGPPAARRPWVLAALGEMALDKLGILPPRYRRAVLIPRALAGAYVAHESLKNDGVDDPWAAPMGAVVAAGVSTVVPLVRMAAHRALGVPDWMTGAAEDYAALKFGSQAIGVPMRYIADVAREAVEDAGEQVVPALRAQGVPV